MSETPKRHSHTGPGDGGDLQLITAELLEHDQITITQGADTDVAVGAAIDDHLLVAFGFASDPNEDQAVSKKVVWDDSAGEQVVRFVADSASSDPTINYSVYKITDTQA